MATTAAAPYPSRWVKHVMLRDGTPLVIRPIKPSDAAGEIAAFNQLSDHSRYQRFMIAMHELTPEMAAHFTNLDYQNAMAFVATPQGSDSIVGVARYFGKGKTCEFALTVLDDWHGRGLGSLLMMELMRYARRRGFRIMQGSTFSTNLPMIELAQKLGFSTHFDPDETTSTLLRRKLPIRA